MSDIPSSLRNKLKENFSLEELKIMRTAISKIDGTTKYLFQLPDKQTIETVLIPHPNRNTICVSTQVGCKFACKFCASGQIGFKRNLLTGEIIDQILCVKNSQHLKRINNLVFMGIGEPLDNYDNVIKAIRTINSPSGLNIGARKITISTSGIIPSIKKLADENIQIELSISLHSADNKTRTELMPVNKKYPLPDLIDILKYYQQKTNRQITFEYLLLKKINDSLSDIKKLADLTRLLDCKVNLISFNQTNNQNFIPTTKEETTDFQNKLREAKVKVTVRKSKGTDIEAGCGQLKLII
jgi:23S rRNA (adenine2503-C2)-methyltransferase